MSLVKTYNVKIKIKTNKANTTRRRYRHRHRYSRHRYKRSGQSIENVDRADDFDTQIADKP